LTKIRLIDGLFCTKHYKKEVEILNKAKSSRLNCLLPVFRYL